MTTLTNALAQEYQKEGIWLRSLDPGANKTPMTSGQGMPKLLLLLRQLAFQAPEKGAKAIYDTAFLSPTFTQFFKRVFPYST